jgi:transposase
MLSLPPSVRIFVATGATDLRQSFDGLSGLAQSVLRQDPLSGHLFIFANRRRDRVKILQWDRSGFLLLYKRLEKGTFRVPERGEIDARELMMLLEGIDTAAVRERRWYRRAAARW